jgi:hypothetical protein
MCIDLVWYIRETFLGKGIFNRDDDMWKMVSRAIFTPAHSGQLVNICSASYHGPSILCP